MISYGPSSPRNVRMYGQVNIQGRGGVDTGVGHHQGGRWTGVVVTCTRYACVIYIKSNAHPYHIPLYLCVLGKHKDVFLVRKGPSGEHASLPLPLHHHVCRCRGTDAHRPPRFFCVARRAAAAPRDMLSNCVRHTVARTLQKPPCRPLLSITLYHGLWSICTITSDSILWYVPFYIVSVVTWCRIFPYLWRSVMLRGWDLRDITGACRCKS